MHYYKWAVCLSTLLCSGLSLHTALAADQRISFDHPDSFAYTLLNNALTSAVVSMSAGPTWENAGNSQTLNLQPEVEKYYTSSNDYHSLMNGQLFLGIQQALLLPVVRNADATGQFGLNFVTTGNAEPSGNIWDDADPLFNNYTYHYQIQHKEVSAKAKLLINSGYASIKPFVTASVGVGFNRADHFNNTPLISEAVASANYSSHTTTAFTYTVGVGIQKDLMPHWQGGVSYEFSDWGKSELGKAAGQTTSDRISLNHLYTNTVLANLTWTAM